jgi:hypothetical protein
METADAVMSGVFIGAFSLFGIAVCGYCIYRQKFVKKMKESRSDNDLSSLNQDNV